MRPKIPLILNMLFCVLAFFEAFTKNVRERVFDYMHIVDYYAGYVFLGLYFIPILIIFINLKAKKFPLGILLGIAGLIMSLFISIVKADNLGDFIVKYHPYIYVLPMLIISVSLKAFNKKFAILGVIITSIYTGLLIKYLGYPHHINIGFNFYTKLSILYIFIILTEIIYMKTYIKAIKLNAR
ncbi:hypothetical protein [Hydrogenobaculum acidophilum]